MDRISLDVMITINLPIILKGLYEIDSLSLGKIYEITIPTTKVIVPNYKFITIGSYTRYEPTNLYITIPKNDCLKSWKEIRDNHNDVNIVGNITIQKYDKKGFIIQKVECYNCIPIEYIENSDDTVSIEFLIDYFEHQYV